LEQLASPATQLVLTPLLLNRLGVEQFGLWVLALSAMLASTTLSLGRSVSLLAVVPRWCAESKLEALRPLILRVFGLIAMTSCGLLCAVLLISTWLTILLPSSLEQPLLYMLVVLSILVTAEIENTLTFALKGLQNFKLTAIVELFGRATQTLITITLISIGDTASMALLIAVSIALLKIMVKVFVLFRQLPSTSCGDLSHLPELHVELRDTGIWSWLQVLSGVIFYSFDRWVVGFSLGPSVLGAYGICSQLAQLPHTLANAACQPLVPWAAAQTGLLSSPAIQRRVRVLTLGASLGACVLPTIVIFAAPQILSMWISPAFSQNYSGITSALAFVFLLLSANVPSFNLLIGWGNTRFVAILTAVAAGVFVLACSVAPPEQLITIVHYKIIYSVIGFVALFYAFAHLNRTRENSA